MELYECIDEANENSGIYFIFNVVNGRLYVGSSVNLKKRMQRHISTLIKRKHYNTHLQNAWDKYGMDSFIFIAVEYTLIENLIEREQFWLEQFDFEKQLYNICPTAESRLGRLQTQETKNKISEAVKKVKSKSRRKRRIPEETRKYLSELRTGRRHSEEAKRKISEKNKGSKRSEESRKRMSDAQKKRRLKHEI